MGLQFFVLALSLAFSSAHAGSVCETSFDKEVIPVMNLMKKAKEPSRWKKYSSFLEKFGPCLDASYAETVQGISEDALANDWKGFSDFVMKDHPKDKVLQHMEGGFAPEMGLPELQMKIQKNAELSCPSQLKKFCSEILKAKL